MDERLRVTVDGRPFEVEMGTTIKELLERARVKYEGQLIAGLRMVKEQLMLKATTYIFETTKGPFMIEVDQENAGLWQTILSSIKDLKVKWSTPKDVKLGAFPITLKPKLKAKEWRVWDVLISAEGLDVENAHIVIVKARQTTAYAVPQEMERLGKVSRGRSIVLKLQSGDRITSIRPVISPEQLSKVIMKLKIDDKLSEPMDVVTKVNVRLLEASPIAAEHFMSAAELYGFLVSQSLSTFVKSDVLKGLRIPLENQARRVRGAVTVRVDGRERGVIYVYKRLCPSSPHHSVVGYVESGMELIEVASPGDKISVEVQPKRLSLLGYTQAEASKILSAYGIACEKEGFTGDEDLVVDQEPKLTFRVLKEKKVKIRGAPPSKVLKVRLYYDRAPKTVWYFKALTGLLTNKVGRLKVYFADPLIGFILFEGDRELAGTLLPENNPKDKVAPLTIGVTNVSKRFVGVVGVRLTESSSYGPTGEDFSGTNVVGEVVGGVEALKEVREGAIVYVMEA